MPKPVPPAPAPMPVTSGEVLPGIALTQVMADSWPESLRTEIAQTGLDRLELVLPADVIGDSLKKGKVSFQWKILRAWLKPAPAEAASAHDMMSVDLPLPVVAPLFLEHQKATAKEHSKVQLDPTIPNLFFGFPQGDAPPPTDLPPALATKSNAVTTPSDTNFYVFDDSSDMARVDETQIKRRTPGSGTDFLTRYATPNEIVSRAAALDGVAGALIALPDGLMVASKLSPELNGDTLAAFLPHIFGKVSQCTKELRMGDLNNLNFTVGNIPWKIFRVNAIFMAAFGHAGQPLPGKQLVALAAELDRKKQQQQ